ncbi:hypothetical protein L218DRAFT_944945 [Marasmius fiardii PR-910]|nr:hypothetical protein L218DRAFT_944945 [Marasmius fiardii PR-910]
MILWMVLEQTTTRPMIVDVLGAQRFRIKLLQNLSRFWLFASALVFSTVFQFASDGHTKGNVPTTLKVRQANIRKASNQFFPVNQLPALLHVTANLPLAWTVQLAPTNLRSAVSNSSSTARIYATSTWWRSFKLHRTSTRSVRGRNSKPWVGNAGKGKRYQFFVFLSCKHGLACLVELRQIIATVVDLGLVPVIRYTRLYIILTCPTEINRGGQNARTSPKKAAFAVHSIIFGHALDYDSRQVEEVEIWCGSEDGGG